jgi:hypothetical protein
METYTTNWSKIDLTQWYQRDLNMLDPYDFETLLLEISCNLRTINKYTVRAQAMESLKSRYQTAIEILNDNLDNIVSHAIRDRQDI